MPHCILKIVIMRIKKHKTVNTITEVIVLAKIYLAEIRAEKKISARRLSDLSGVSKTHILHIEKGGTSPTVDCLCKLAWALNVDVYELFSCGELEDEE